jgi:hypothetical protein
VAVDAAHVGPVAVDVEVVAADVEDVDPVAAVLMNPATLGPTIQCTNTTP